MACLNGNNQKLHSKAAAAVLPAQLAGRPDVVDPSLAGPPSAHARGLSVSADGGADRWAWSTKKRRGTASLLLVRGPYVDPGRFHVAGDPAQAEYERRRAAFLDWDNRQGSAPTPPRSAVLDLAGLAGILTRSAAEWTVHCVVASQ